MTEVVGKVAVKVIPDTKGFRQHLKAALEKAERGLHVDIEVELDDKGLRAQAKKIQQKIDREIKDVKLNVDLEERSSVERAIAQIDRELSKLRAIEIPVGLNESDLKAARELLTDSLSGTNEFSIGTQIQKEVQDRLREIKVGLDPDPDSIEEIEDLLTRIAETKLKLKPELDPNERRKVERELERLQKQLNAKIEPEIEEVAFRHAQGRLIVLARDRIVNLIPVVSKGAAARAGATIAALSGARVVDNYLTSIRNTLRDLDKNAPRLAVLKLGLSTLASYSLTAASNIFSLGRSLAQIVPAALALPGILGGLTIGIGATIAVFRDFNKVLPEVGDMIHELQDSMSQKFWDVAEAPIRNMIDTLFPQFQKGIEETSTALGGFFGSFATNLTRSLDGRLEGMFANLNESIRIATRSTDNMADIIAILGSNGAERLPELAAWFDRITTRFDNFLTKADNDGRLDHWIDRGVFQLQELGRAIAATGSIFSGLARAAEEAGGSTLTMFADTLEGVAKVVNGDVFQTALIGALEGAHEAMSRISDRSGPAFQSLMLHIAQSMKVALPVAGQAAGNALNALFSALDQPAVMLGSIRFLQGLESGFNKITPGLFSLGTAMGGVLSLLGTVADNLGSVLSAVFEPLGVAIARIAPALEPVVDILGNALTDSIRNLSPVIDAVADAVIKIGEANTAPMQDFANGVVDLTRALSPKIVSVVEKLGTALAKQGPPLLKLGSNILPVLTDALEVALDVIGGVASVLAALPKGTTAAVATFLLLSKAVAGVSAAMGLARIAAFNASAAVTLYGNASGLAAAQANLLRGGAAIVGVGLLSLTDAAYKTHTGLGTLTQMAGTAALGFAAGGPLGAALGAGVGALLAVKRASDQTTASQRGMKEAIEGVRASLEPATGAVSKYTRELVAKKLAEDGALGAASKLSVGLSTITDAATGNQQAIVKVRDAITTYLQNVAKNGGDVGKAYAGLEPITSNIEGLSAAIRKEQDAIAARNQFLGQKDFVAPYRQLGGAVGDVTTKLGPMNQMLADFQTKNAAGLNINVNDIQLEAARAKLAQMGIDYDALGTRTIAPSVILNSSEAELKFMFLTGQAGILNTLPINPTVRTNTEPAITGFNGVRTAGTALGGQVFGPQVRIPPAQFNAAMTAFTGLLPGAMAQGGVKVGQEATKLNQKANAGVQSLPGDYTNIGSQAGEGLAQGIESAADRVAAAADRIVEDANRAAEAAAEVQSPSRRWRRIGGYMGEGLAIGIERMSASVVSSSASIVDGATAAIESVSMHSVGSSIISSFIDGMESKYRSVTTSLETLGTDMKGVDLNADLATRTRTAVLASTGTDGATAPSRTLIYNAAPTSNQLDGEEDLFEAANRARMMLDGPS